MNSREHILTCISEECSEVQKEISKALRFGIDDINPETNIANRVAIARELNDLIAVVEMAVEFFELLDADIIENRFAKETKKSKVHHYMGYARITGALTGTLVGDGQ